MDNKYSGVSVKNISSILFESRTLYCYNLNSVLLMTYSKYVSTLSMVVAQMFILSVHGGFFDNEKYLLIPVIISDR